MLVAEWRILFWNECTRNSARASDLNPWVMSENIMMKPENSLLEVSTGTVLPRNSLFPFAVSTKLAYDIFFLSVEMNVHFIQGVLNDISVNQLENGAPDAQKPFFLIVARVCCR